MTHSQSPHIRVRFGIYHFVRRVPADVQQYYRSDRVSISLRTKSPKAASRAATRNSRYVVEALGNRPITAYA